MYYKKSMTSQQIIKSIWLSFIVNKHIYLFCYKLKHEVGEINKPARFFASWLNSILHGWVYRSTRYIQVLLTDILKYNYIMIILLLMNLYLIGIWRQFIQFVVYSAACRLPAVAIKLIFSYTFTYKWIIYIHFNCYLLCFLSIIFE